MNKSFKYFSYSTYKDGDDIWQAKIIITKYRQTQYNPAYSSYEVDDSSVTLNGQFYDGLISFDLEMMLCENVGEEIFPVEDD